MRILTYLCVYIYIRTQMYTHTHIQRTLKLSACREAAERDRVSRIHESLRPPPSDVAAARPASLEARVRVYVYVFRVKGLRV